MRRGTPLARLGISVGSANVVAEGLVGGEGNMTVLELRSVDGGDVVEFLLARSRLTIAPFSLCP